MNNKNINKTLVAIERYFWLFVYFFSPVIPIVFIYNSDSEKWAIPINYVSMMAGTTGFVWLVYEFILSARPKFIEKCFGLDKLYIFHGVMAVISVILIAIHRILVGGFAWTRNSTDYGNAAHVIFIGTVVLGVLFISSSILLKIKFIVKLKNFFCI